MKDARNNQKDAFERIRVASLYGAYDELPARAFKRAVDHGANDPQIMEAALEIAGRFERQLASGQLPPYYKPRLAHRELILGTSMDGARVGMQLNWLMAGLLIAGNTGSTKTKLLEFLIIQAIERGVVVWASDMYKQSLRHLRRILRRMGREWIILRPNRWRFNLL